MASTFKNKPESWEVMPQLRLETASGRRYSFRCEKRSTTNSIPISRKKIGMERTMGFRFKSFRVNLQHQI